MSRGIEGAFSMRPSIANRARTIRGGAVAAAAVFLWLSLPLSVAASGPQVVRIRHYSAPDHTRIVLDLTGPADFEVRRVGDPDRIAINVQGAEFAAASTIAVGDGVVKRIRRNSLRNTSRGGAGQTRAQVVVDLSGPFEFRQFSLPSGEGKPDRIVVDVLRSGGVAPEAVAECKPVTRPVIEPEATPSADTAPAVPAPAVLKAAVRPFTVIVDPGHGGLDPGAMRGGLREKDVVLDIAREVARLIDAVPGYRAVPSLPSSRVPRILR